MTEIEKQILENQMIIMYVLSVFCSQKGTMGEEGDDLQAQIDSTYQLLTKYSTSLGIYENTHM